MNVAVTSLILLTFSKLFKFEGNHMRKAIRVALSTDTTSSFNGKSLCLRTLVITEQSSIDLEVWPMNYIVFSSKFSRRSSMLEHICFNLKPSSYSLNQSFLTCERVFANMGCKLQYNM